MKVSATRDIQEGEELLLSYGGWPWQGCSDCIVGGLGYYYLSGRWRRGVAAWVAWELSGLG